MESLIIGSTAGLHEWFLTAPGRYLLDWEQAQFEQAVADVFGYHALQLGLPELDALGANRMPHRWLALDGAGAVQSHAPEPTEGGPAEGPAEPDGRGTASLRTEYSALPFSENSLDLVILPHTLELNADPHATLREVGRVLMPEGRVVISGLNPASLWGLRQRRAHLMRRAGFGEAYLPDRGEFIGYWRLRDWLRLLNFEVESSRFGCYRPAVRSGRWLARFEWMDRLGARWWPIFGAAYFIVGVKRVHGARLMSPGWKPALALGKSPVSIANYHQPELGSTERSLEPH
ncbi:MAG TPA: methyltransferase domain-containing protein [Burkholderiaceae bacterium]|nr:methyltransferase domain-containing protein [Burkholderiaceae bacterium]